jgi:hypothetical protein
MKTAIYIEDGVVQLVLTPENDFEKNALNGFAKKPLSVQIFEGTFYDCRGGWVRQSTFYQRFNFDHEPRDTSLILKVAEPAPEPQPTALTP